MRRSGFGEAPPQPLRFTNADVAKMYASGVLDEDKRVELIAGEIFEMPSEHSDHVYGRSFLLRPFVRALSDEWLVTTEASIFLFEDSEVRPDLCIYPTARPSADVRGDDIALIVEIMVSSHQRDQALKLPVYARAGIIEVWLEDLLNNRLHVYQNPKEGEYLSHVQYGAEDPVSPKAFPEISVCLANLKRPEN